MNKIKTFDLSISAVIMRFYLMMAVVIAAGFSGYWLFALLALPIFLSIMMGVNFNSKPEEKEEKTSSIKTMKATTKDNLTEVA